MPTYVCEFELVQGEKYIQCWPFFPGRVDGTQGTIFDDAIEMAADWLRIIVLDYLMSGEEVPTLPLGNLPRRGGDIIVVAVDASLDQVPAVGASEAARMLGVSTERVSQLISAGHLESWKVSGTRMVSVDSIEARAKESEGLSGTNWELGTA